MRKAATPRAMQQAEALPENRAIARAILGWYDRAARRLPWRAPPGAQADPYHVWLSEIMLQQTTVKAVIPYYGRFLARWPDVAALASADLDAVLGEWAGLGYYSRARNLHACAKAVVAEHGGRFPADEARLRALPGVGTYTAAAIAAIAFGLPSTVVDGNVERVVARLFAVEAPLPAAKTEIRRLAARLTPEVRPGDYAQGMMDLGATVCTPRGPSCEACPLSEHCAALARGLQASLPVRAPKAERPQRYGAAFVAVRTDGAVLLRRRPPRGLLGGMLEVPSTDWGAAMPGERAAVKAAPVPGRWRRVPGAVTHTFTHFHLTLHIWCAQDVRTPTLDRCRWYPRDALAGAALPSVMRKVLAHASS